MNDKDALRKEMLSKRMAMDTLRRDSLSTYICINIMNMQEYRLCNNLFSYMPIKNEANVEIALDPFMATKLIYMPRCIDKQGHMEFFRVKTPDDLEKGSYGILEPSLNCSMSEETEGVILVPGVAFDKSGYRLGYGAGYYDRYLARYPKLTRIGVAFEMQICDMVYSGEYDCKMDYIVTEDKVYSFGGKDKK